MKIVVLTNGSKHGLEIIRDLKKEKINIQSIFLEKKILRQKELNLLKSKIGKFTSLIPFKNSLYSIYRKLKYNDNSAKTFKGYSKNIYEVPSLTGKICEEILSKIKPDIIVLGGSRILKENIINIPKIGTLNAHPGILPYYRGLDVIKWALYNNDKIGVTIHYVDSKIDSGPICLQEELNIKKGSSIHSIKDEAIKVSGRLMSKVVSEIINSGEIRTFPNELDKGTYYKTMNKEINEKLIKKLSQSE